MRLQTEQEWLSPRGGEPIAAIGRLEEGSGGLDERSMVAEHIVKDVCEAYPAWASRSST